MMQYSVYIIGQAISFQYSMILAQALPSEIVLNEPNC